MVEINSILGEVRPGVQVLNKQQVGTIFTLRKHGWSVNAISEQFGWSRNTIQGWLDRGLPTSRPTMGRPRKLADEEAYLKEEFQGGTRNGAVLRQQLIEKGVVVGVRTVERAVETMRQEFRAAEAATLRYETDPGKQIQIDLGVDLMQQGLSRATAAT